MGMFTYLIVKDLYDKTIESNALLIANVIVGQSKVVRNVYIREVISKLRKDGTGAHVNYNSRQGYIPISAQFQRMLSDEAKLVLQDIQYKPVSKWNIGPYSTSGEPFYEWGWSQLELQNNSDTDEPINWKPVWRIEKSAKGDVLRYMDAIPATSINCLTCHQKYEDTAQIKKIRREKGIAYHEYKLNHLLGAFTIDIPLNNIHKISDIHLNNFIMWITCIMIVSFIAILWFSTHSLQQLKNMKVLNQQSNHDPLTGLMNRRGFNESLDYHLDLLKSDNIIFSLCILDLDGFKIINDTYGHQAGDELLREIASVLHASFREKDIIVRLGGDEFSVILDGCDIDSANKACSKLLTNIRSISIDWKKSKLSIGASIGIFECSDRKLTKEEAVNKADDACYKAKANGKNQIFLAQPLKQT